MEERRNVKKIRLTRHIILDGEHAEKDGVFIVARSLAQRLIGEGSAVEHVEEGEEPEAAATTVGSIEQSTGVDPQAQRVSRPKDRKAR